MFNALTDLRGRASIQVLILVVAALLLPSSLANAEAYEKQCGEFSSFSDKELRQALRTGTLAEVECILDNGADPNAVQSDDVLPLSIATIRDRRFVDALIASGARVQANMEEIAESAIHEISYTLRMLHGPRSMLDEFFPLYSDDELTLQLDRAMTIFQILSIAGLVIPTSNVALDINKIELSSLDTLAIAICASELDLEYDYGNLLSRLDGQIKINFESQTVLRATQNKFLAFEYAGLVKPLCIRRLAEILKI